MCIPTLVLIVQAVFLLKRGQTYRPIDTQTHTVIDATDRAIPHASATAGVVNLKGFARGRTDRLSVKNSTNKRRTVYIMS